MGARPIALLDGLCASARPTGTSSARSPGSAHYGNCVGVPNVGGETVFDEAYAGNCLVNAMCVGLLPTERVHAREGARAPGNAARPLRRDDRPRRDRRRVGAREPGARRGRRREAAVGAGRRPVHRQEADRGLARARRARARRVAAGLRRRRARLVARRDGARRRRRRRPPRPRAAARGRHGAVGDHDLRSRRSGWSRSSGRSCSTRSTRCCARWELPCTRDRRGDRHRRAARASATTRSSATIPARVPHRRVPALRGRAAAQPRRRAGGAESTPVDLPTPKRRWIYEQYDQLVGSRTVRRPGLDAAVLRLRPSLRGLAVSLDGPPLGERDPSRRRARSRCSRRRATSPAPAASRSRSPTASTSATRRSRRSRWELARGDRGDRASRPRRSGSRSSPGNVSLYNETDGRAIPPTPVVGCVGLVPDVRACPAAGARATRLLAATALWLRSSRRTRLRAASRSALAGGAVVLSLAHDVARRRPRASRSRRRRAGAAASSSAGLPTTRARERRPVIAAPADADGRDVGRRARSGRASSATWVALMCGVFGIRAPDRDVARARPTSGCFALQHRGQESAGIAVSDDGRLTVLRDMGLVTQVFDEQKLRGLRGERRDRPHALLDDRLDALGERAAARSSTAAARTVALGHNGNLVNATRAARRARGRRRHARVDLRHAS